MLKKVSLRWRLTMLTSLIIALCCIGLSVVLNFSAYRMADIIDAAQMQPAFSVDESRTEILSSSMIPVPAAETQTAKDNYLLESLFYTLLAVLTGGFLTYYISGKALTPVKALNDQIQNINTHNLSESLEVPPTQDEIAELTASFNDMTDKLNQAFSMQKRFSADAAHELRTPLAVMQTRLDVFRKKEHHTLEEYEILTASFQKQTERLRNLVTELLDIANMEEDFEQQEFSLLTLLEEVLVDLTPVAAKKNVALFLDCKEFQISGDCDLLYRAFYNLVENAIKYNIPDGRAAIAVSKEAEKAIQITVTDTGIGIPDTLKKQIFEPFYRVDKSRSREMGGAGLGLSLTERIIKRHNGTITVSDSENGGTCFSIMLPHVLS